MKKERNSSLELLRIISMFLIIAHHYVVHGDFVYTLETNPFAVIYLQAISIFGKPACMIFALITGYFMIEADTKNKFYRRIIPTLFRMIFCSLVVFGVVYLFDGSYSLRDFVVSFIPFSNDEYWYVNTYVCFFFFIPFINELLLRMDRKRFRQLLTVIFIVYFVLNTVLLNEYSFGWLYFMLNLYAFGAYYRLYVNKNGDNRKNILISLGCAALMIVSSTGIVAAGYFFEKESLLSRVTPFASYSNILSFGFAYYLFVYFANKNFVSKTVNLIASTVLSIYMLHDRILIRQLIWFRWFPNAEYANNPYLHSIVKIVSIFVICMLIDFVRQLTLSRLFKKTVYKKADEVLDKVNKRFL